MVTLQLRFNEKADAVDAVLAAAGIKYAVFYRGEKRNALSGASTMDRWDVDFTAASRPQEPETFEFFTGLGLRKPPALLATLKRNYGPLPGMRAVERRRAQARLAQEITKASKPDPPRAADVLHSLLNDSQASWMSFDEWCSEYGYDNDSIKAEGTFDACRRNDRSLRKVITPTLRSNLEEVLQGY